ncbi:bifunctional protein tyrosine phosphatase family protein/NAD(P)/FAD-dependent oxidoreductase [Pseudomonas sp. RIT-PI-AD]|uniref:bifunctional protein tyrosine phosphatase family protein/NAD(P)/FAD-dependent oxidoreductase n=1 Tax=Pseudomonas sp. RIT-PI-AD TaxID=3035294 RepID=UPI0021D829D1|nr:bifunctional protein tyrosine phosphatase family protein/NAD(P)/FAD-dependent oxidoreductase [Pseudomonas sp. RIT-PI-AD]
MDAFKRLTPFLFIAAQLDPKDIPGIAAQGFRLLVDLGPRHDLGLAAEARRIGLDYRPAAATASEDEALLELISGQRGPVLILSQDAEAAVRLWALAEASSQAPERILETAASAGFDIGPLDGALRERRQRLARTPRNAESADFDVVVIGGGAAGCAVTSSLLKRNPRLRIAVLEPAETHYYQPGWTLVGAGVFSQAHTHRPMQRCIPPRATWIRQAAKAFHPQASRVLLADGSHLRYRALAVCTGLELDWNAIEGLDETLGRNGVTSNYAFDLAPYTWECVQALRGGRALFTQPPVPIKCAGAPQKAMYLSCDWWRRRGVLDAIQVDFCSAGAALFSVAAFVPALMRYVERYNAHLHFGETLVAVDGPARLAHFRVNDAEGNGRTLTREFDLLHLVPPQRPPACIGSSPLANPEGWLEVDPYTLQHLRHENVFGLGDIIGVANAKTAAAVRKQAPVVAENLLRVLAGQAPSAHYDGYGACPLTVERGRVVLAEFGYDGRLLPSFPLDPRVARRSAWALKTRVMPRVYFDLMLKGREWLTASHGT